MPKLKVAIRVVLYKEDGRWYAHCLEFNLLGDGDSQKEAMQCLGKAIMIQIDVCIHNDNLDSLFSPADGVYFRMFAAGKNIATGEIEIDQSNEVEIEQFSAREYDATPVSA